MSELKANAWSAVNKALQLDSDGLYPEAYKKYLEGIRKLCIYLEEETDFFEFEINPVAQQKCMQVVSVIKKSLERLEQFSSNNEQPNSNGVLNKPKENILRNSSNSSLSFDYFNLNLAGMSQPNIVISSSERRAELSPIEKARRENGLIYRAYQARCQLVKDSKKRASLYLELHRKLTENIIVARAKEAAARQKQIEKEKGILELAAKKLDLQSSFLDKVTNNTEDWEKLLLYAQIIQYEEKEIWPSNLREKLKKFPENRNVTSEAIKLTLSTTNHPLALWVCKSQNQLLERIQFFLKENDHVLGKITLPDITIGDNSSVTPPPPMLNSNKSYSFGEMDTALHTPDTSTLLDSTKVSLSKMPLNKMWVEDDLLSLFDPLAGEKRSSQVPYSSFIDPEQEQMSTLRTRLNEIVRDTVKAIEMLVQILCATYELTTDLAQEICYQMAENFLFQGVWPQLLQVFRIINYKAERNMSIVMERLSTSPPEEVGIPSYFNLAACQDEALAGLRRLSTLHTPIAKLHQLVNVARTVCSKKTHSASGRPFGADDLIGIMCYLLVQTKMPHLLSEFEALEQLVPHRYLMGEEGYALTSHLTAIKYLESQIDVTSTYFYDVGEDAAQNI